MRRHPNAGAWQVMAAETILRPRWNRSATQSSPVLCRGTAWGCCPSPHAESGLRAGRPVCRERGAGCTVCGRPCGRVCRVLWLQRQGLCGKMERQLLLLLPWRPRDAALVLAVRRRQASATQRPLLEGLPAQRHRSASLVEEEPHPERHRSSTSRRPRRAALVATLCPYEKELQQPVAELPM